MNKVIIYIFILINLIVLIKSNCVQDWECGNAPYTRCRTNKTVIDYYGNNIDIDRSKGRILFTVKYPDEFELRIISIPVSGSVEGKDVISHSVLYGQSTYQLIRGLQQFVGPISYSMVVNRVVRIAGNTANIFYSNNTFGNELTWTQPGNFIFYESDNIQITCWPYGSKIIKGKIGDNIYSTGIIDMYLGQVTEIKRDVDSTQILILSSDGTIYQGNINGPYGIPISTLPSILQDSNIGTFEISDDNTTPFIYYTNKVDKKIYKIPRSNPSGTKTVILDQGSIPTSFKYYKGYLYYQIGSEILRVSANGNNSPQVLFDSSSLLGHCICSQGFSGQLCNICDQSKNIISWNNGIPRCIPINWKTNNPVTCDFDWQCTYPQVCKEIVLSGGNKGCQLQQN